VDRTVKLGKKAAKHDPRTLKLSRYLWAVEPAPPACDWTKGVTDFGQMLNTSLGDCVYAGIGHAIQVWTMQAGHEVTVPDSTILSYYEQWSGYNPSEPSTDNGAVELDVLTKWRQQGFAGQPLSAFASVDPQNIEHVRQSIFLMGGIYLGIQLPRSAEAQVGGVWDVEHPKKPCLITRLFHHQEPDPAYEPGSWGGHCVFAPSFSDHDQTITCLTWGKPQKMTYDFFRTYCDEAYALLSPDWLNDGHSPQGFDLGTLSKDLQEVTG